MEIRALLERMGYKDLISSKWYSNINLWKCWYSGSTDFHKYMIYNGSKDIPCIRKTLRMAKKVSEDKADLLLNEKVEIQVSSKGEAEAEGENLLQKYLDQVLEANNFWVRSNQLVEFSNAFGTGAFVEYKDNDKVCIDFVQAPCIYPLSWYNGDITECAFASEFTLGKNGKRVYINRHVLEEEKYVVYNDMFDEAGKEVDLPEGVEKRWDTGSATPLFQIITPNIANNIDTTNPMGVSVYADSIDLLEKIDLIFDSDFNEFKLGKKRLFVDDSVVKPNPKDGTLLPIFDTNDTVFYGIPGKDQDKSITESNMELRTTEHNMAMQTALDMLSEKCGFGKGYYKFDVDNVQTATAVISQNSKLYRKIRKDEIILEKALIDLTRAILFLGGKSIEAEISVNFDDSIIEDTDAQVKRAILEIQNDLLDEVGYLMRIYKKTEDQAIAEVQKMKARKSVDPPPLDPFGDGA